MKQARETRSRERLGSGPSGADRALSEQARTLAQDLTEARELLRRVLSSASQTNNSARERENRRTRDSDQGRLELLLERAERDARFLERRLRDGDDLGGFRGALTPQDFQDLVTSIKRKPFADDQLEVIRLASRTSYFSCDQVRSLVRMMTFSDGQEDVAVLLYPRLVDPQRFHTLSDAFKFSSSWRTVTERLNLR